MPTPLGGTSPFSESWSAGTLRLESGFSELCECRALRPTSYEQPLWPQAGTTLCFPVALENKHVQKKHDYVLLSLSSSIPTYLPIYLSTYLPTNLPIYQSTNLPIYQSTYLYLSLYIYIYITITITIAIIIVISYYIIKYYVYIYIHMCVCIYIYIYIYTYIHTHNRCDFPLQPPRVRRLRRALDADGVGAAATTAAGATTETL